MPVTPPVTPPAPLTYAVLDIITDSFIEIGACAPGENPSPEEQQWGLRKLNDLIDVWQAKQAYVYSYDFAVYTLVVNKNPQTIGPSGLADFSTGNKPRPVRIESAALLLQQSNTVDLWINVQDRMWWALQTVKDIQTNVPTDLFYDPTFEDGSIFFWPVSNIQRQVRLQLWTTVSQFTSITDPIGGPGGPGTLPQGYRTALKLTLAEMLCPGANRPVSQQLAKAALEARAAVFGNNAKSPRIATADFGMPTSKSPGQRQDFNWAIGNYPGGRPQ
jgi:hypothetical protein